jgi:two-component system LytT family response regulator
MSDSSKTFALPVRRLNDMSSIESFPAPTPQASARPAPLGLVPRAPAAASRVLVAIPDAATRALVTQALPADALVESVEVRSAAALSEAIRNARPDVLFLEVDLSGLSGFDVLDALEPSDRPATVFVTSEPRDAARAFEADAADCVVRPFSAQRIAESLARARARRAAPSRGGRRLDEWLLVKKEGRSVFVRVADIDWIESARNNVILHVGSERYVHHETTSGIEARLDAGKFLRIHRSAIVRIDRVKELSPWFNGDYRVTLKDGTQLTLSESYRGRLKRFRGQP